MVHLVLRAEDMQWRTISPQDWTMSTASPPEHRTASELESLGLLLALLIAIHSPRPTQFILITPSLLPQELQNRVKGEMVHGL